MATNLNINSLPEDVMLEIFSHLSQNDLCRISRVCKKWNAFTKSPVLWKEVDVKYFFRDNDLNETILTFADKLPLHVTQFKLYFCSRPFLGKFICRKLNFEKFCMRLNKKCPNLHTLILHNAHLSVDLCSVIDLCSKFLLNLKVLILYGSKFGHSDKSIEHDGSSKLEILDISSCFVQRCDMNCISKTPFLKALSLYGVQHSDGSDDWLLYANNVSFLERLEFLNLGFSDIDSRNFDVLKIYAINLTELFLCSSYIVDKDLNFNHMFPLLKSICLRFCKFITCRGIKYLLQSCPSLENVHVDEKLAKAWAKSTFNKIDSLGILKDIDVCYGHNKNYSVYK